MKIAVVSDVSVGFGSPQLPALAQSLGTYYEEAAVTLIEPDEPDRSAGAFRGGELNRVRVRSTEHPHTAAGRIEYLHGAASHVAALEPHILVLATTFTLPVLFLLRKRPNIVIYYQLEPAHAYGRMDIEMNHHIGGLVDVIIYPEENRAWLDIQLFGDRGIPFVVMFNCSPFSGWRALPPEERNGTLLYHGVIEEGRTYAEYFADSRLLDVPIDLYGRFGGHTSAQMREKLRRTRGRVRYVGMVDSEALEEIRRHYSYSLVAWNPRDPEHLYACPNKFFEAIAAGVPPITAPHPQCRMLVERYGCGIVLGGWDFGSFRAGIDHARSLLGTPAYQQMVENCQRATLKELTWELQFAKLTPHLQRLNAVRSAPLTNHLVSSTR